MRQQPQHLINNRTAANNKQFLDYLATYIFVQHFFSYHTFLNLMFPLNYF